MWISMQAEIGRSSLIRLVCPGDIGFYARSEPHRAFANLPAFELEYPLDRT